MARNGSGVYSLPAAYLAVTGDDILATQHNTPLEDLESDANTARPIVAGGTGATSAADALTNLGAAPTASPTFTGVVKNADGTAALPSYTFTSDPNTGIYRIGADNIGVSVGGSKVLGISSTGTTVTGTLTSTGAISGTSGTFTSPVTISAGTDAAPSLIFSGDSNTGINSPAADTIGFVTGGTSRLTITPSGNTVSLSGQFLAQTGSAGAPSFSFQFDPDTGLYRSNADTLNFVVGGTSSFAIDTSNNYLQQSTVPNVTGTIPLGATGLRFSKTWTVDLDASGVFTTGGQIAFPSTQNSSSGANTLDDYEEGTFTPDLKFGGSSIGSNSGTYTTQAGRFQKVGNRVNVQITIVLSAKGTATGSATIAGLPFTSTSVTLTPLTPYMTSVSSVSNIQLKIPQSGTTIDIVQLTGGSAAFLTDSNFTNTTQLYISGVYEASA